MEGDNHDEKVFALLMAPCWAMALVTAGCGGNDEKQAGGEKLLRVGTEPSLRPLKCRRKAARNLPVLTWI